MGFILFVFTMLVAFLLASFLHYRIKYRRFWKLLEIFYGDEQLPVVGNAHQIATNSEGMLLQFYELFKRSGYTTYKFIVGRHAFVFLCDPDTIEVLLSSTKEIRKMDEYLFLKDWLGDGLLLSTGTKWKMRRKIITPTFHFKILEQFVTVFNDNGNILMEQLSKHEGREAFNIYPFINAYTLDVICETAMGVSINAQLVTNSEYVEAVRSICRLIKQRMFSPLKRVSSLYKVSSDYKQFCKDIKVLHNMTNSVIKARKNIMKDQIEKVKNGQSLTEKEDEYIGKRKHIAFLDLLLLSRLPDGSLLSDEDIREETDTFMFEGHDTTASCISFSVYTLANNPEVQQKALEEVLSIVGEDPNKEITYEQLQDMKYIEMVIKETLRLYPSVPGYGRYIENDLRLPDGKIIPAGCTVVVDMYALGRSPKYYPNFEKFDPERFSHENQTGKNPFMYVPFSAGSRNCIGQKFAMLEIKNVLAKLLLKYELISGGENAVVRPASELILKTVTGVQIKIKERKL